MKVPVLILVLVVLALSAWAIFAHTTASKTGKALDDAQSEVRRLESELAAVDIRAGGRTVSQDGVPDDVLRSRIAELEAQLSARDTEVLALNQQFEEQLDEAPRERREGRPEEEARPGETEEDRRERMRAEAEQRRAERMAQWREENPEEYAQMQERRQEAQRRVVEHVGGQVEFFSGLSTEGLSREFADNHAALVERLAAFQARVSALNSDPAADNVDRRELFGSMREIGQMLEMERQVVLNDFARELGYAPEDASAFIEYIDYVDEMTSPQGIMRSMGGFGGGRGGRGGGRGGR